MGQYTDADERFVTEINQSLVQRQIINANRFAGVMSMQAEPDDRMSTCLKITRDEFKQETNRTKLRESAWQSFVRRVGDDPSGWTKVQRHDEGGYITITFSPPLPDEGRFNGLSALRGKNAQDIADNPDLAEPYWEL